MTSTSGATGVTASDAATIDSLVGGAALALNGTGVGVGAGGNYVANTVDAEVTGATANSAHGDVTISATEGATIEGIVIGLAGGNSTAVAGSLSAGVIENATTAKIGDGASVTAGGKVGVTAMDSAAITIVAGQLAVGGKVGVGASLIFATILDTNTATISALANVKGTGGVTVDAETNGYNFRFSRKAARSPAPPRSRVSAIAAVADQHHDRGKVDRRRALLSIRRMP